MYLFLKLRTLFRKYNYDFRTRRGHRHSPSQGSWLSLFKASEGLLKPLDFSQLMFTRAPSKAAQVHERKQMH